MQRIILTGGNRDVVLFSNNSSIKPLPRVFTVNDSGKKVKFSPGNLFWDGEKFDFEKHQYDFPTIWDPNHVGHFFWSKNANIARAELFEDGNQNISNRFFAADDAVDGYTVLSKEEWRYLFEHSLAKNSSGGNDFIIDGKRCLILKPDSFDMNPVDSYMDFEWNSIKWIGLVALPFAGYRFGSSISNGGSYGNYWSGTPYASFASFAYSAYFYSGNAYTDWDGRDCGYSVRLVQVQVQ